MFSHSGRRSELAQVLTGNVGMHHRLKRTLSDVFSTRKRAATDFLLESLGRKVLLSRTSALTTEQIRPKKCEEMLMRRKSSKELHGREDVDMR